jgi:hypothetical protein
VRQREAGIAGASRELAVQASARRRSCGGGLLREMRERDGIDPDFAMVISGGARMAVSRTRARSLVRCTRSGTPEGEAAKQRQRSGGGDRMQRARRSHTQRAPFIHAEVEAGATRRGFDVQRKTGSSGRPVLMASQQMERAAELQDLEVRGN